MSIVSDFSKALFGLTLILVSVLFVPFAYAQLQQTSFVPVAPETLSSAFVRCIYKDARGFMWFGTGNGLIRYDGTNTYHYEHIPGDSKSLPNNRINAIIEDASHNLWIGTAQGLVRYNSEKNNFIDVDSIAGNTNYLINKYITALCFDRQGKLWIGTHGHGLHIYNPKTFTFTYLANPGIPTPPGNYITTLSLVGDTMWAGTKGGLKLFSTIHVKPEALHVANTSITSKEIKQVVRDPTGNMWVGTVDKEIIKLSSDGGKYVVTTMVLEQDTYGEGAENILTFSIDAVGNLWIGGENSGLSYLDTRSMKTTHYGVEEGNPKKLQTNSIRYVYVDNTGIVWIGTFNKGAYLIDNNAKKFDIYQRNALTKNGLPGNDVTSLAEDKDGNVWIACDDGGLGKLDTKTGEFHNYETINNRLGTRYLTALLYDSKGNLWIGTWGRGVYRLNPETYELKNYKLESNGFGDNKVFHLYEDRKNNIWAGSAGSGLFYVDSRIDKFVLFYDERESIRISKTAYVTSVLEDDNNTVWVATLFGLYGLRRGPGNSYDFTWYVNNNEPGSIGGNEIQTIHKDTNNTLWFGTNDKGMAMLESKDFVFKNIRKQDGLSGNAIKTILSDAKGNLWIGGSMGLSKYDPAKNLFRNYTKEDGLPSNEFNANACLQTRDGKFYFGTDKGLIAFYPDSIRNNPLKPVVYLTDLKLNNQSAQIDAIGSPLKKHISLTSEIELPYSQRSFVIDFAAINYGQSSKKKYCFMLEGFDQDWNCTGSSQSATYTNIDPGHYIFLVKAYTNDGILSEVPARLEITIHQALWKTWWAYLSYALLLTSLIFFLIKIRIERIKIKNQLELERVAWEKEHALSESKTQFFTNISHELRTPLSLIAMPLESLIAANELPPTVRERLGTIRTSTDKMMRLVNELMDFNKLESTTLKLQVQHGELVKFIMEIAAVFKNLAEKKNIHFGIHTMIRSLEGWFDHDKLEKILVNVLSNAFKFTSDNGQINIIVNSKESVVGEQGIKTRFLEIVIIDNGIGISPEELPFIFDKFYQAKSAAKIANPGTGIGLSLTKGLIELHHGSITVESTPDHETKFVISIPVDHQAYREDDICEIPGYIVAPDVVLSEEADDSMVNGYTTDDDQGKPQILLVEDNDELRKYIVQELRQQFTVLEAKDGKQGLDIAFEKSPDLIISDILMPFKNGIELCREIKSNLKTSHIPLVLLTAKTTVDDQIIGIETGADVYITKPFSIRFLTTQVNQIIASRQKLYSRFSQDVYLLPGKIASNEIDQSFLQKAIDYIVDNIQDPQLSVDSIAGLFNLSRMQVYRKIKALTGKSVVDFIRMVRIKQALKLMDTHQYTLSEIAYQTGFNSASYFTRCFKDHYGKAPSEYLESTKASYKKETL